MGCGMVVACDRDWDLGGWGSHGESESELRILANENEVEVVAVARIHALPLQTSM